MYEVRNPDQAIPGYERYLFSSTTLIIIYWHNR
jgi:hypothetical protein